MPTLLQIRDRCKQESDNVGQSFVSDAEWNSYINSSYSELYGIVVQAFGNDYFVQTPATGFLITTTGLTQFYNLPATFFKLLGVDLQVSQPGQWVTLKPFAFADRNRLNLYNSAIPMAGQVLRLFYVPRVTALVADGDVMDGVNGWEEYIIADACIKALTKEETDVSVFMQRKQALMQRLESEAENRDAGQPASIVDSRGRGALGMRYRLNGNQLWLIGGTTPGWAWDGGDWSGEYGGGWGAF